MTSLKFDEQKFRQIKSLVNNTLYMAYIYISYSCVYGNHCSACMRHVELEPDRFNGLSWKSVSYCVHPLEFHTYNNN